MNIKKLRKNKQIEYLELFETVKDNKESLTFQWFLIMFKEKKLNDDFLKIKEKFPEYFI